MSDWSIGPRPASHRTRSHSRRLRTLMPLAEHLERRCMLAVTYEITASQAQVNRPSVSPPQQATTSILRVTEDYTDGGAASINFSGTADYGIDYLAYKDVYDPQTSTPISLDQYNTTPDYATPFSITIVPLAGGTDPEDVIARIINSSSGSSPGGSTLIIRDPEFATIEIAGAGSVETPSPLSNREIISDQGAPPPDPSKPQLSNPPAPGISMPPTVRTAGGINGFNGAVSSDPATLLSNGFGKTWALSTDWTNMSAYSKGSFLGKGVVNIFQPAIQRLELDAVGQQYRMLFISSATSVQYYYPPKTLTGSGTTAARLPKNPQNFYRPNYAQIVRDIYAATEGSYQYEQVDEYGNIIRFYDFAQQHAAQNGRFKEYEDAYGNKVTTVYNTATGYMDSQSRTDGTSTERFSFTYIASGGNEGLISDALLERKVGNGPFTTVRKAQFEYYTGDLVRNLKFERILDPAGGVIDTSYYRYYTDRTATTYRGGMSYIFRPDSYARLYAAFNPNNASNFDPSGLSDTQVAGFADNHYEYDRYNRVTKSALQGAGAGGIGNFTYLYQTSPSSIADGINNWRSETIETLPDGNKHYYYYNYVGQLILDAFVESPSRVFATSYRYDSNGRLLQTALPSAVAIRSLSDLADAKTRADLIGYGSNSYVYLYPNKGVIHFATYGLNTTAPEGTTSSSGDVEGYLKTVGVMVGHSGTSFTTEAYQYYKHTDARSVQAVTYPLARVTRYPNENLSNPRTTLYDYAWYGTTSGIRRSSIVLPAITALQNGSGISDSSTTYYDTYGRPTWVQDGDGYVHYTQYDNATGAAVKAIADINTAITSDYTGMAPFATKPGAGMHLVTTTEVDGLGRPVKQVDAKGAITHWIYIDVIHQVRTYRGWDPANRTTTGPIEVTTWRQDLGILDTVTLKASGAIPYAAGPGGNRPNGEEGNGTILTLTRDLYDLSGRLIETRSYHSLANLTYPSTFVPGSFSSFVLPMNFGSLGVNYYASTFGYDERGRPSRFVNAVGTITRTAYDALGRAISSSVGTNDDPNSSSYNMTPVSSAEYDGGQVGDGNLTTSTAYPGAGASARVTKYAYDPRGRLVAMKVGDQGEDTSDASNAVQRQLVYSDLNNLGETLAILRYDADGIGVSATKPGADRLRARTEYQMDNQGRVHLQGTYSVEQSNGSSSQYALVTRYFYDRRGYLAATYAPGGLATKDRYDGAGRVVSSAQTDGSGGLTWAAAVSISSDNVLTETRTTYDAVGNPILVTTVDRHHNLAPGNGLRGAYFNNQSFSGNPVLVRVDPTVDFDWGALSPQANVVNNDSFAAQWLGFVDVPAAGPWTFYASVDDGARLWVDGVLMFDDMNLNSGTTRELSGTITLQPGRLYSIRLDYFESTGQSKIKLSWSGPGTEKQVVPKARLRSLTPLQDSSLPGEGLTGKYYNDPNPGTHFTGSFVTRVDPQVVFAWNGSQPDPSINGTNFSVVWTGSIEVPNSGNWSFSATVDDGVRVYVNNTLVVDDFVAGGSRPAYSVQPVFLEAGRLYSIRVEYFQAGGGAAMSLVWSGPGQTWTEIKREFLHPDKVDDPIVVARASYAAFYYDAADRLTDSVNLGTNGGQAYARPATVPAPSATALVTSYKYNDSGWVGEVLDPRTNPVDSRRITTRIKYDALGRTTQVVANATALESDPITTSSNSTTRYTYDGLGRVLTAEAVLPGNSSQTTTYAYGVVKSTGGSAIASNDLLASVTQPDKATGGFPTNPAGYQTAYRYNALGQAVGMTDANGTSHVYAYDVLGRLISDAIETLGQGVDGTVLRLETAYDTAGLAYLFTSYTATNSVANQVSRSFNGLGQLTAEFQQHGGAVTTSSPVVTYAYTVMAGGQNNSRPTSMTYPNGRAVNYAYNGLDAAISRITAITEAAGSNTMILESYGYLGLGTVVVRDQSHDLSQAKAKLSYARHDSVSYAPNADGGDRYTGFDRFGRVIDQNWIRTEAASGVGGGAKGTSTVRLQYTYDESGNALTRRDLVNTALSELYAYDGLNRLTSMKRGTLSASNTITAPNRDQSWTLDAMGNWSSLETGVKFENQPRMTTTTSRTFNAANEATSVTGQATPSYTANGNSLTKNGITYTYDAWNRLKSAGGSSYTYDALGRRVVESYGTSETGVYYTHNWHAIEERTVNPNGVQVIQYVFGVNGDVIVRDINTDSNAIIESSRLYAQQNANGDVMATILIGIVKERYRYDAYGSITVTNADGGIRTGMMERTLFRNLFQGGRYDYNTDLYLFQNRDLDPADGTWMQRDPMGLAAGDMSLRRFVGGNPINRIDPTGLAEDGLYGSGSGYNPLNWYGVNWVANSIYYTFYTPVETVYDIQNMHAEADTTKRLKEQEILLSLDNSVYNDERRKQLRDQNQHPLGQSTARAIKNTEIALASSYNASGMMGPQPIISRQQQAGHVWGTKSYINRIKENPRTSYFHSAEAAERLVRIAYAKGTPIKGRPQLREYDFKFAIGWGPNGGTQTKVIVSEGKNGIHGYPAGPERF